MRLALRGDEFSVEQADPRRPSQSCSCSAAWSPSSTGTTPPPWSSSGCSSSLPSQRPCPIRRDPRCSAAQPVAEAVAACLLMLVAGAPARVVAALSDRPGAGRGTAVRIRDGGDGLGAGGADPAARAVARPLGRADPEHLPRHRQPVDPDHPRRRACWAAGSIDCRPRLVHPRTRRTRRRTASSPSCGWCPASSPAVSTRSRLSAGLLEQLQRSVPFDRGGVYVRASGGRLSPLAAYGTDRLDWDVTNPLFDEAWASSSPVRQSQPLSPAALSGSAAAVPLQIGLRTFGLVAIEREEPFDPADLSRATDPAGGAGAAPRDRAAVQRGAHPGDCRGAPSAGPGDP